MTEGVTFTIGRFSVIADEHLIRDPQGHSELLQPKFIEVLTYLAQHYPRLVSREELIQQIWDGNQYVGEKALTNAVWHIRQKLHAESEEYIQTVRKGGYRLLTEPQWVQPHTTITEPVQIKSDHGSLRIFSLLATLLVFVVLLLTVWREPAPQAKPQVSALTSSPGREIYPAVSPDGTKLLYYWKQLHQPPDLYLQDLTQPGLAPEQLTFDSDRESRAVWGKDNQHVYFVQKSWKKDRCHIVRLTLATKEQLRLAPCKGDVNPALSISHDGNTLAFNGTDNEGVDVGIYLLALDQPGAQPRRLSCARDCEYSDRDAVFSADPNKLAFTRRAQQYEEDIFLFDRHTSSSYRLTTGQTDIHGMAWHPRANKLVYSAEIANQRNAYLLELDSGEIHKLDVPGFSYPTFIGDSNNVAFHDWQAPEYISILSLEEQVQSVPFPVIRSQFNHREPHYNSHSQELVYVSNESGDNEIWIANWDGTQRRQLTHLQDNVFYPRWSHAGDKIAYLLRHKATGKSSVYILDVKTRGISELKTQFTTFDMPSWSQDDLAILVEATNGQQAGIYRIPLNGEAAQLVLETTADQVIQARDGSIWYANDQGLFRQSLPAAQTEPELVLTTELIAGNYSWLHTETGIYFLQTYANYQQIAYLDLTSKQIRQVLRVPLRSIESSSPFALMPEQKQMVFTQATSPQVDIKMLQHPLLQE